MILLRDFKNGDGARFRALVEARSATDTRLGVLSLNGKITLFVQCVPDGEQLFGACLEASAAAFAFVKGDLHAEFFCSHLFYSPVVGNKHLKSNIPLEYDIFYNISPFIIFYKSRQLISKVIQKRQIRLTKVRTGL